MGETGSLCGARSCLATGHNLWFDTRPRKNQVNRVTVLPVNQGWARVGLPG